MVVGRGSAEVLRSPSSFSAISIAVTGLSIDDWAENDGEVGFGEFKGEGVPAESRFLGLLRNTEGARSGVPALKGETGTKLRGEGRGADSVSVLTDCK